jgi:hypothetical protein
MKMKTDKIFRLGVLMAALLFAVAAIAREDFEESIKKSFQVGEGGKLTVESDLGSIEVHAVSGNTVDIEIIRKLDAYTQKEAEKILQDLSIDFDHTGKDVSIITKYNRGMNRFFDWDRNRLRLHYIISVPLKYNVDLSTAGGSISVDDLEGEVISKTSGGSLTFGKIKGPVTGNTSGGSITLQGCTGMADLGTSGGSINIGEVDGKVNAQTSGGSINITRAKGSVMAGTSGGGINVDEVMGEIDASTSGGSVTAHITKQPQANCRLSTSGGSVNVYLAEGIAVDLDAETSGGRVKTDFPVTVQGEINERSLQAKVNGGGPELYLRTSGGNIRIAKM